MYLQCFTALPSTDTCGLGPLTGVIDWLFTYLVSPLSTATILKLIKGYNELWDRKDKGEIYMVYFLVCFSCLLRGLRKITFNLKSWHLIPLKYEYKKLPPCESPYSVSTASDLQLWSVWSSNFFLLIHRCLLYMYRCIQKPEIITVWTCPPTRYKYCVCMYIHERHE